MTMHRKSSYLRRSVVPLIFLMLLAPQLTLAITVAKSGGDYFSIQDAIDNASPGDTIYVREGTYNEKIEFNNSGSQSGGHITLTNYRDDRVVLDGRDVDGSHMIYIENKSYIIVDGFEIRNNLWVKDGSGIRIEGHGSSIEIRNNKIHEITGRNATGITVYGISATPINNLIIDGNEIYNAEPTTSAAIVLNGNIRDFEIKNNTVHDVNNTAIEFIGGESWTGGYVAQDGLCKGNVVYNAKSEKGRAAGIRIDGARDITVEENRIYNSDVGIEIGAWKRGVVTSGIIVRRNSIYENSREGIYAGGYAKKRGRVENSEFYNNVLYKNQLSKEGDGEIFVQFASSLQIKNNIIVAGEQGVLYSSWNGDEYNTLDFNCYYVAGRAEKYPFYVNSEGYESFKKYQDSTSRDQNSLFINPRFSDEGRFDFSLTKDSPCIDAGTDMGIAFSGKNPDMGAVEFTGELEIAREQESPLETPKAGKKGEGLELQEISLEPLFPVLFKYYDDYPFGKAILHNWEERAAQGITVSLFVRQYMDTPKMAISLSTLEAGEEELVELTALFTERVLEITEGTKVSAEIILEYVMGGKRYRDVYNETLRLYDRNASTWDDDRKAAAFVTARDPAILKFAKNIVGVIQTPKGGALNKNLAQAIALFESLALYRMSYVIDPTTPYIEFSKNRQAVDFLQFPRQTLEYRAGDCDDLSILYSALLEAVGIETAFITIPEHMLMAFSANMKPEAARKAFSRADELIFRHEKTWIPVEVTAFEGGFLRAWQIGAQEWRDALSKKKEGFFPTHDSWKVFEPVGLPGVPGTIEIPKRDQVEKRYADEVQKYIERTIYPEAAKIQAEIKNSGEDPLYINKLGVLYARYGLLGNAEKEFKRALSKNRGYAAALINLGNIHFLQKDMEGALKYYEQAARGQPENPKVVLSIARAHHALENYGMVRRSYFSYLGLKGEEAVRAADIAEVREIVVWEEE
jgi:tetratricopeptide (TPR) repeat protein